MYNHLPEPIQNTLSEVFGSQKLASMRRSNAVIRRTNFKRGASNIGGFGTRPTINQNKGTINPRNVMREYSFHIQQQSRTHRLLDKILTGNTAINTKTMQQTRYEVTNGIHICPSNNAVSIEDGISTTIVQRDTWQLAGNRVILYSCYLQHPSH